MTNIVRSSEPNIALSTWQREFRSYVASGYQILFIQTSEESRCIADIQQVCRVDNMHLISWDIATGFKIKLQAEQTAAPKFPSATDPIEALSYLTNDSLCPHDAVYVMKDLDDFLPKSDLLRRMLQNISEDRLLSGDHNGSTYRPLVIVSSSLNIPLKLRQHVASLEFGLPNEADLRHVVEALQLTMPMRELEQEENMVKLVRCLAGLTSSEADNAASRAMAMCSDNFDKLLATVKREKARIIKQSETLSYVDEDTIAAIDDIGGFDNFNEWLDSNAACYSREAVAAGMEYPKGVCLMGMSGTGKSIMAKALAKRLGLPCYTLDIGAVFSKYIGDSEQKIRDAIKTIEAQDGCVVLIDEIDKALGGMGDSDSGVGQRVLGTLLTWLAEKKSPTFVVVTLNRVEKLPPEMLRSGRFDAIFCTSLPSAEDRKTIFRIHLKKRGRIAALAALDADPAAWPQLVEQTHDYVGAEIETIIVEAQRRAFTSRRDPNPNLAELMSCAEAITPVAKLNISDTQKMSEMQKLYNARPVARIVSKETQIAPRSRAVRAAQ